MSTITAHPSLLAMLNQLKEATEIQDPDGKVIGVFTPKAKCDEEVLKLFDLDRARETYEREKDRARPFREMIDKLDALASRP
jgi:hypothetical protein